jgi:predicted AAA+ superfamily ATPase
MKTFDRLYSVPFSKAVTQPFVHIMFGARQTGKSTLQRNPLVGPLMVYFLHYCENYLDKFHNIV